MPVRKTGRLVIRDPGLASTVSTGARKRGEKILPHPAEVMGQSRNATLLQRLKKLSILKNVLFREKAL
jgi:hypothetical protein